MRKIEKSDVLVIGGGLLGCFAARSLREYSLSVTVLEAREDVCTGISKANTAVVYSGCDTKPGSLKTEVCVRANAGFDRLCTDLGVPFSRCGSLMVATGPAGEKVLKKKYEQGIINGVPGIALISAEEAFEMEPSLSRNVTAALYVPVTGTVNPWLLCIGAYENAVENGADFRFNAKVSGMERTDEGFRVITDECEYEARAVVNCAGLSADIIREMTEKPLVRISKTGADYFILGNKSDIGLSHVVFLEPEDGEKGLTLVPVSDGNILVGASKRKALDEDGATDMEGLRSLEKLCYDLVPGVEMDIIRTFAGTRPSPRIVEPGGDGFVETKKSINDFPILKENGLFSLVGIKTPGLTCAHELSRLVASDVVDFLGPCEKNEDFSPIRKPIFRVADRPLDERRSFVSENPASGRIVCRCCEVTEAEIVEAIRRGAKTVNGVKRRVGSGMGPCQGSRCTQKIVELIGRELSLPVNKVTMDGRGSELIRGGSEDEV